MLGSGKMSKPIAVQAPDPPRSPLFSRHTVSTYCVPSITLSTKQTQLPLPWEIAWGHRPPNRYLTVGRTKRCEVLGDDKIPGPEVSQKRAPWTDAFFRQRGRGGILSNIS